METITQHKFILSRQEFIDMIRTYMISQHDIETPEEFNTLIYSYSSYGGGDFGLWWDERDNKHD